MEQHWASHKGKRRWGVRAVSSLDPTGGGSKTLFVWADRVAVQDGCLLFFGEADALNGALAAGQWQAVFLAAMDDTPEAVETP